MTYVYLVQSISFPYQTYIGLTEDLRHRLNEHNAGESAHTRQYKRWPLVAYVAFADAARAAAFERYLKSASGRAFANKRLH